MIDNVVSLAKIRDESRLIWVCKCGCTTHHAYADGTLACASCEAPGNGYDAEWRLRLPETPDQAQELDGDNFKSTFDLEGPEGFMRRHAKDKDVAFVAIAYQDGSAATLNVKGYDTPERVAWFKRMMRRVSKSLNPTIISLNPTRVIG